MTCILIHWDLILDNLMARASILALFNLLSGIIQVRSQLNLTADDLVNICSDDVYHKTSPSPEPGLSVCTLWRERSCCLPDSINEAVQKFTQDFLPCTNISRLCRQYFLEEFCMASCSPYLGPWIISKATAAHPRQTFRSVPLCKNQCKNWFEACKSDILCTRDWSMEFDWRKQNCDNDERACQTFEDKFTTAKSFCETVSGGAYKVVENETRCLFLVEIDINLETGIARREAEDILINMRHKATETTTVEQTSVITSRAGIISYCLPLAEGLMFTLTYWAMQIVQFSLQSWKYN